MIDKAPRLACRQLGASNAQGFGIGTLHLKVTCNMAMFQVSLRRNVTVIGKWIGVCDDKTYYCSEARSFLKALRERST